MLFHDGCTLEFCVSVANTFCIKIKVRIAGIIVSLHLEVQVRSQIIPLFV